MMTKSATISTGSFTVTAGEGIEFDLYYLHHFDTEPNRSGNYNLDTHLFAGYEINYDNPVFSQIHYNSSTGEIIDDPDPTNINHLWPAHKVTYAIVVTSGTLSQFTLESWDEVVSEASKIRLNDEDVNISLSWATDIYGGAYYVTKTANVLDDLATGFSSYKADTTLEDKFLYSQTNIAPVIKTPIELVDEVSGEGGENKVAILYFSIEFSDDSSTYYSYTNPYYVKDPFGNSNCYEKLSLKELVFKLV